MNATINKYSDYAAKFKTSYKNRKEEFEAIASYLTSIGFSFKSAKSNKNVVTWNLIWNSSEGDTHHGHLYLTSNGWEIEPKTENDTGFDFDLIDALEMNDIEVE